MSAMMNRLEDMALRQVLCDTIDALNEISRSDKVSKISNLIYLDALICRGINFNKLTSDTLFSIEELCKILLQLKTSNKLSDDDFRTLEHMLSYGIDLNKLNEYTLLLMYEVCNNDIRSELKNTCKFKSWVNKIMLKIMFKGISRVPPNDL